MENNIIRADQNGDIIIELDKPRALRLSHKALKLFSALTHTRMSELGAAMEDYEKLSCLYYCMLHTDDPTNVTTENIDDLLERVPVKQLIQLAAQAIEAAFGDDKKEDDEENPTA